MSRKAKFRLGHTEVNRNERRGSNRRSNRRSHPAPAPERNANQYSGLKSKWWIDSRKRTVLVFDRITTLLVIAPPEKKRTPRR
jgi:hypothetical protein